MTREILIFHGHVINGSGNFANDLGVPGRDELSEWVPEADLPDWPERVWPGSLNVRMDQDGWPSAYLGRFGNQSVKHLDGGAFAPAAILPAEAIQGNTLPPTESEPDKGRAQIWPALLINGEAGHTCRVFVLRRVGSSISRDLELVAGDKLRERLKLENETPVAVHVEGSWRDD